MRYRQTPHHIFGYNKDARPSNAGAIWRTLCWVNDQIAVSGDLPPHDSEAVAQLQKWVSEGVTDIIDLRGEASHESLVARIAPHIKYHWLGVDDEGDRRTPEWFEAIRAAAALVFGNPHRKAVIHCHMGVNRGPSAAFTALITNGVDPIEALGQIRAARPIAAMIYAGDAIQWFAEQQGNTQEQSDALFSAVLEWHMQNPLDVNYCIQQIGQRYAA
jgi:predicted protein tyrosine phosphatase